MAVLAPYVFWQEFDNDGEPLAGGKVYTYAAGTITNKVTYTDADETAQNTNPIILDASGRANIWLDEGAYKFVITDSNDVVIKEVDDFAGDAAGAIVSYYVSANLDLTAIYDNANIYASSTFTINLLPAATAGDGFQFRVLNTSTGVITIDPNSSETINGTSTITIPANCWALVYCDGENWRAFVIGTMGLQNANAVAITGGSISGVNFSGASSATSVLADELLFIDVNDSNATKKQTIEGVLQNQMAFGFLSGLAISNDAGDTAHDILILEGQCRDAADSQNIRMTNNIIKQIDANWAEGDSAGGFPSGLTLSNNTWYHVFVIAKTDGTVDAGFDTSLTATNLLADATGYTKYRRVGSVITDGSANIRAFAATEMGGGDLYVSYSDPSLDVSVTDLSTTAVLYTIATPLGIKTLAHYRSNAVAAGNTVIVLVSSPDNSDEAPSVSAAPLISIRSPANAVEGVSIESQMTNTSSQLRARATTSSTTFRLSVFAFTDFRR